MRMVLLGLALAAAAGACRGPEGDGAAQLPQPGADRRDQTPISVNADPPVQYPPELYEQGVEGTVRDGVPVSTVFEQPIIFQHSGTGEAVP
jgi:hypothetical protein